MKLSLLFLAVFSYCFSHCVIAVTGNGNTVLVYEANQDPLSENTSKPSAITLNLIKQLKISEPNTRLLSGHLDTLHKNQKQDPNQIVIAVGGHSLERLILGKVSNPIMATFISQNTYDTIIGSFRSVNTELPNNNTVHFNQIIDNVTAIFSDPDPLKQLLLFTELYGNQQSVGMVRTQETEALVSQYQALARAIGVQINEMTVDRKTEVKDFVRQFKQDRSLILLRDKTLFRQLGVEEILLNSYDLAQKGIIVYSSDLVKRGGLATTYSSFEDIVSAVKDYIIYHRTHEKLPASGYPQSYHIVINRYLARSLNIPVDSQKNMKARINRRITEHENHHNQNLIKNSQGRYDDGS